MTPTRPTAGSDLPDSLWEEAAIWHARMREPAVPPARRAEFNRWLGDDPRHGQAFHETVRLWAALERPVARVLAQHPPAARRRRLSLPPRWALAASLAAILLAALPLARHGLDDMDSDYLTTTGERRSVRLADGSEIQLNTSSALAVDLAGDLRRATLHRGEAWFDVARDPGRPFVVETPAGTVRVIGTRFNVRVDDGSVAVSLMEGRVDLAWGDAGQTMRLAPGQQATLRDGAPPRMSGFDATAVTGWQRGQMVFYGVPLGEVVAELNRYRPGRIVVADSRLAGLAVTGVFDCSDPEAALEVIRDTLPVRVTRLTDYLVLLR